MKISFLIATKHFILYNASGSRCDHLGNVQPRRTQLRTFFSWVIACDLCPAFRNIFSLLFEELEHVHILITPTDSTSTSGESDAARIKLELEYLMINVVGVSASFLVTLNCFGFALFMSFWKFTGFC